MPIFKQLLTKQIMENALEVIYVLKEEDEIGIEEFEYYSLCYNILERNGLTDTTYSKLLDFYIFKFCTSDLDHSKTIKSFYKNYKIEDVEFLAYIKRLNSTLLRVKGSYNGFLPKNETPSVAILSGFLLFLVYMFDLCTGNKKFYITNASCKYKDLDNLIPFLSKTSKKFVTELAIGICEIEGESYDSISYADSKKFIEGLELATFQKYKLKHDTLLIQLLLKNLMPNEISYYSSRMDIGHYCVASLMNELMDNECNMELSSEFYSLLRKRAYLIPHNGLSLNPGGIDFELDLYERQLNGDNYLIVITNIDSISYFTFINLNKNFTVNNSPWLYDICNFLFSFYKLEDVALSVFGEEYDNDPILALSFRIDSFIATGIKVIKGRSDVYKDFTVESPYYWRYKETPREKVDSKVFYKSTKGEGEFTYISAFKRKLPNGYKPSDNAKFLSKVYCIELEEGETLVSPFERSVRV